MSDLIDRQAAIDAVGDWIYNPEDLRYHKDVINSIPAVQPNRAIIDNCLYHIATGGAISIKHYMQSLYEEIYGEGEKTVVDEMISRRAAIDALDVLCQEHRYKIPGKIETYSQYNEAWQDALDRAEVAIFNLPSVQPDHVADINKKVSISCSQENDLISRQQALKELAVYIHLIDKTMGKGTLTDDDCMEAAKSVLGEDELPAVQPEIIRCKDCEHWRERKYLKTTKRYVHFCRFNAIYTEADDYCSKAERRTDE